MRSLAALLTLALAAPLAAASPLLPVGAELAAVPPERLAEKLAAAHKATDAALKERRALAEAHQTKTKARDAAAAAVSAAKAKGDTRRAAALLADANRLDEEVQSAQARLRDADQRVAREGAILVQLYDALLVEKRRELERLAVDDARRATVVDAYRRFAGQRDAVRDALAPVLTARPDVRAPLVVTARPGDDVETLLEKADLARDLEARLVAQANTIRQRIVELEADQRLARDVAGLSRTGAFFEEADRRLKASGTSGVPGAGPLRALQGGLGLRGMPMAADSTEAAGGAPEDEGAPPPSSSGNVVVPGPDPNSPNAPDPDQAGTDAPPPNDSEGVGGDGDVDTNDDFAAAPGLGENRDTTPVTSVTGGGQRGVAPALGPSEQVFLGNRDGRALSATNVDGLSLDELRALEAQLRADAQRMKKQGETLRASAQSELARGTR